MDVIKIRDLNYSYGNKIIFEDLNLNIKKGTFLFLAGPVGSGKTTLIKILLGLISGDFNIEVLGTDLKNIKKIRKKIGMVFENPINTFVGETVFDEISFSLENLNIEKNEIKNKIDEIVKYLEIEHLLNCVPHSLSGGEQELVSLASALVIEPEILIIDESLSMIDNLTKQKILKKLKNLNRTKKTTIICVTQDLEDTIFGKELVILNDKKIVLNKKIKDAFEDEKIFKKCNLALPFMADLSNKLKYYGLIEETILDMDKMVNKLWK